MIASRDGYGPYSAAWIVTVWPASPVTFTVSVIDEPGAVLWALICVLSAGCACTGAATFAVRSVVDAVTSRWPLTFAAPRVGT